MIQSNCHKFWLYFIEGRDLVRFVYSNVRLLYHRLAAVPYQVAPSKPIVEKKNLLFFYFNFTSSQLRSNLCQKRLNMSGWCEHTSYFDPSERERPVWIRPKPAKTRVHINILSISIFLSISYQYHWWGKCNEPFIPQYMEQKGKGHLSSLLNVSDEIPSSATVHSIVHN